MWPQRHLGRGIVVYGAQYGSEGKGHISSYLAHLTSLCVRTGAANAGHTIVLSDGECVTVQHVPTAFIVPGIDLIIGVGAIIHLPTLMRELETLDARWNVRARLRIDQRAHVTTDAQLHRERLYGTAAHIASTSYRSNLGIAETRVDKIRREPGVTRAGDVPEIAPYVCDTHVLIRESLDRGSIVLFEGSQGFGLCNDFGAYPFVTSQPTTAQAIVAHSGVNAHRYELNVIGVVRTFPIRVAGESGPLPNEISWAEVAQRAGTERDLTEYTSVTNLPRRVSEFDWHLFDESCFVNQPTELALMFADHLDDRVRGVTCIDALTKPVRRFIAQMEEVASDAPVTLVGTGPNTLVDLDPERARCMRALGHAT